MRIRKLTCFALNIPFVEEFRHSAKSRTFSDSIVVKLESEDGTAGFGEAVPRPYVTGESVDGSLGALAGRFWKRLRGAPWPALSSSGPESFAALADLLDPPTDPAWSSGDDSLDAQQGADPVLAWNAARCALELALLDGRLRKEGKSLGELLPARRRTVAYSGVVTSGSPDKAGKTARHLRAFGINTLKIKTGGPEEEAVVAAVRLAAGPEASLRIDSNGAYAPEEAVARLARLAAYGIACAEQPIPRGRPEVLAALRAASPVPLMADESLVTLADGEALAALKACDFFNLRLSKCGGIGPCLKLADLARAAGLRMQLGCQVGETAVLSAAGRHLAAHLDGLAWVEGSFGALLLSEDVGRSKVQFGHGGLAPTLRGPGLGVEVDEDVLRRHAVAVVERED